MELEGVVKQSSLTKRVQRRNVRFASGFRKVRDISWHGGLDEVVSA